jgi:UDP-N-acetylglucosamine acyltransferase
LIDSRAIIDKRAELAEAVSVGPFSIIGPDVKIGSGTVVGPHVVISGPTTIGENNRFFQFSSIGEAPQDKKYAGEPTELIIGNGNVFRESCTIHRGTAQDRGITTIGNNNLFMAYTHVAHDCLVGDGVIMSNSATLAGHVELGDQVILGGFTLVHQFCKVGKHAFTAMGSQISRDVIPFVMVGGSPSRSYSINAEGLKRRGFESDEITSIRQAYKILFKSGLLLNEAVQQLEALSEGKDSIRQIIDFIAKSDRSLLR